MQASFYEKKLMEVCDKAIGIINFAKQFLNFIAEKRH